MMPSRIADLLDAAAGPIRRAVVRQSAALCPVILLITAASASAQTLPPPPVDYSGIIGAYRIASSAAPTDVEVEQPIILRVLLHGTGPEEHQPALEKLRFFPPGIDRDFFVEPAPELNRVLPDRQAWEFVYRLRPKSTEVKFIPSLKLVMYNPARKRYQPSFADPIAINVRPADPAGVKIGAIKVLEAPESFFHLRAGIQEPGPCWTSRVYAGVALGTPLGCLLFAAYRGMRHPDQAKLRARRRSRAARRALLALKEGRAPASVAAALGDYLRDRLDFPGQEPTPQEARAFLARRGLDRKIALRAAAILDRCAAARFAPEADSMQPDARAKLDPLVQEAAAFIQAVEDACDAA